jgi:superoxide reductase
MMVERLQVYGCGKCGNLVEVIRPGDGEMACCGQPMKLLVENTLDAPVEKHVPVIERTDAGIRVRVGSIPHPMVREHWIEWVQVITEDGSLRRFLAPGDEPEAVFPFAIEEVVVAREHCNLHGLWKGEA